MANAGRTLFSQVMDFVPWTSVDRIVARYGGEYRVRAFRCSEQFRVMAFAQLTYRESLRDIEACLGVQPSKLYGMGLRAPVARSMVMASTGQACRHHPVLGYNNRCVCGVVHA